MSICAQAKRVRRRAKLDPRYVKHRRKDVASRQRRLQLAIETERRIKGKGK